MSKEEKKENIITRWERDFRVSLPQDNKVVIVGYLTENFEYSYMEKNGERYYRSKVKVRRPDRNKTVDFVPISVPESLIKNTAKGKKIELIGKIRIHRSWKKDGKQQYTDLHVMVLDCRIVTTCVKNYINIVFLEGKLMKEGHYGEITKKADFMLGIGEKENLSFVPCIGWGKALNTLKGMKIGTDISFFGRFQSRKFFKENEEGERKEKMVFEISTLNIL